MSNLLRINMVVIVHEVTHEPAIKANKAKRIKGRKAAETTTKRLAVIIDGAYEVNGRLSNHWSWRYVDERTAKIDNLLPMSKEFASGCNNGAPFYLEPAEGYMTETKVRVLDSDPTEDDADLKPTADTTQPFDGAKPDGWFINHKTPVGLAAAIKAAADLDEQLHEVANCERKPGKVSMDDVASLIGYVRQMAAAQA